MSCNIIERKIKKTETLNTRSDEGGGGVNIYIFCEAISVTTAYRSCYPLDQQNLDVSVIICCKCELDHVPCK